MANHGEIIGFLMSGILFLFLLLIIHRSFLTSITFEQDRIIYKSLFKKVILNIEDVKDIVIVEKQRRSAPEFESYYNDFSPNVGLTSYFIMIGNFDYYPSNPYFLLTSPVKENYITLQYREELREPLRRILEKVG